MKKLTKITGKAIAVFLVLLLLPLEGLAPLRATAFTADWQESADVIDLTGALYGNNFVSPEEVEAIRQAAEAAPASASHLITVRPGQGNLVAGTAGAATFEIEMEEPTEEPEIRVTTAQSGSLFSSASGSATFSFLALNFDDQSMAVELVNVDNVSGISLAPADVSDTEITISIAAVTAYGTHPLRLRADGVYSDEFDLVVTRVWTIAEANAAALNTPVVIEGYAVGVAQALGGPANNNTLFVQDGDDPNDGIEVNITGNLSVHIGNRVRVPGNRVDSAGIARISVAALTDITQLGAGTRTPVPIEAGDLTPVPRFRSMAVSLAKIEILEIPAATGGAVSNEPNNAALVGISGGQRIELRPTPAELTAANWPDDFRAGDIISVDRAFVTWQNARGAVQLVNATGISLVYRPTPNEPTIQVVSGSQSQTLFSSIADSATFTVETYYISEGAEIALDNDGVNGITLSAATVANGDTTITINIDDTVPAGNHQLTLTAGGATSEPFTLLVVNTIAQAREAHEQNTQVTVEGYITGTSAAAVAFMQMPNASGPNDGIMVSIGNASSFIGRRVRLSGYVRSFQGNYRIDGGASGAAVNVTAVTVNSQLSQITPVGITIQQAETGFHGMLVSITEDLVVETRGADGLNNHSFSNANFDLRTEINLPADAFNFVEQGATIRIHRGHIMNFNANRQFLSTGFAGNNTTFTEMTGIAHADRITLISAPTSAIAVIPTSEPEEELCEYCEYEGLEYCECEEVKDPYPAPEYCEYCEDAGFENCECEVVTEPCPEPGPEPDYCEYCEDAGLEYCECEVITEPYPEPSPEPDYCEYCEYAGLEECECEANTEPEPEDENEDENEEIQEPAQAGGVLGLGAAMVGSVVPIGLPIIGLNNGDSTFTGWEITLNTGGAEGVSLEGAPVINADGTAEITVNTTAATPSGEHPLTITISAPNSSEYLTSAVFYLRVASNVAMARAAGLGSAVTVVGIVTNFYETAANNNNSFFMQDIGTGATSGIHVRLVPGNDSLGAADPNGARAFVGHLVEVTGVRQRPTGTNGFQGVDNITVGDRATDIVILERDVTLPEPVAVNFTDLAAPGGQSRPFSSMLVSVEAAQLHGGTSGPSNHILRGPGGNPLSIDGNTFIVNSAVLPEGAGEGDWLTINRANVHWWAGRNEVQLRVIDPATDISLFEPPVLPLTSSIPSGGTVPIGGIVTLSTETPGAEIFVQINEGGWEQLPGGSSVDVEILEEHFSGAGGELVIDARARIPNPEAPSEFLYSFESRFTFTQSAAANVTAYPFPGRIPPGTAVRLTTETEGAAILYRIDDDPAVREYNEETGIVITAEMFPVTITAWATKEGYIDGEEAEFEYEMLLRGGERVFFGQMHAHTTLSDGQGSPEVAFSQARDIAGLDFFMLSDHSNWFDLGFVYEGGPRASTADGPEVFNLREYNRHGSTRWEHGNRAAAEATVPGVFYASNGFEFTWSGGPGHINTFNTTGWVCRNNAYLNTGNHTDRLLRYYALLQRTPESVSMFNHPGTTFGNFHNFAHFTPETARMIPLIEVANGEGAIGSGGYFPSYEQFTLALDRGWLLAPVNSQDNHRGNFGFANEGRVAIYTNNFSYEGIWQALRDRAAYSTEIRDMQIRFYADTREMGTGEGFFYGLSGEPMGTIRHDRPDVVHFGANVYVPAQPLVPGLPRDDYTITRIELVTNGGIALHSQAFNVPSGQVAEYRVEMPEPQPGYYFLRVIARNHRGAERIAVTAPIWIGRAPLIGIAEVTTETFMPLTGEELTLTTHFFNDEALDVTVSTVELIVNGQVVRTLAPNLALGAESEMTFDISYTPANQGIQDVQIRANINVGGGYRVYNGFIELNVRNSAEVGLIGIDASLFNKYVAGLPQPGSFTNFAQVAAGMDFVSVVLHSEEDILRAAGGEDFQFLLLAPPSRHAQTADQRYHSEAVIEAIADFVQRGGTAAIVGFGNFNDRGNRLPGPHGSHVHNQNLLLQAIGSNIRIGNASHSAPVGFRETANEHEHSLRFDNNFNIQNPFMRGVITSEADPNEEGGQLYRNFSTGALYVVSDPGVIITNADDVNDYVLSGNVSWNQLGVDPMVFAHPGSWTMNSSLQATTAAYHVPFAGATFPRYNHPQLGLLSAPPQGMGAGQRPADGGREPGQHLVAASQEIGENGGTILVFASHFFSNFDVRPTLDFAGQLPNANLTIVENILASLEPPQSVITPIADVRRAAQGRWFNVQGRVTAGLQLTGAQAANNTGFMNSIYIQDETGGINLFEVTESNAAGLRVGQLVEARGFLSEYQGEAQLTVHRGGRIRIIDTEHEYVQPTPMTTGEIPTRTGMLAQVFGRVSNVIFQPGMDDRVLQFTLNDGTGPIPVYMRDYITPGVDLGFVTEGALVSVAGLASIGELAVGTGPRVRVRDRNEIQLIEDETGIRALLAMAIYNAEATLAAVSVSVNGSDVPPNNFWVTRERRDAFVHALGAALGAYNHANATVYTLADALNALLDAVEIFAGQIRPGTMVSVEPEESAPPRPQPPPPEPPHEQENHEEIYDLLADEEDVDYVTITLPTRVTEIRLFGSTVDMLVEAETGLVLEGEGVEAVLPLALLDELSEWGRNENEQGNFVIRLERNDVPGAFAGISLVITGSRMPLAEFAARLSGDEASAEAAELVSALTELQIAELANALSQAGVSGLGNVLTDGELLALADALSGQMLAELAEAVTGKSITTLSSPVILSAAINVPHGVNTHRIVAVDENGNRLGGVYDPATGVFTFETTVTGEFTIEYAEDLRRINLRIGLPTIRDLAQGVTWPMDAVPIIQNDRTLVPVRFIAEILGAAIEWNDETREVTILQNGRSLTFAIGETAPGMDVPAQIINERTFVPLRFIAEHFYAIVKFDDELFEIEIVM